MKKFIKRLFIKDSSILIYHHLGLGDHIILSGGLRFLLNNSAYKKITCFCLAHNYSSVQQLFSNTPGLLIVPVVNIEEADHLYSMWRGEKKLIGFENMHDWVHFDSEFYRILNVPFEERWNSFDIKRNLKKEEELYNKVAPSSGFAFVHDDISRGYKIDQKYIDPSIPIVNPVITDSIFDWITLLEKATEIHCICSSFKHLVDSLPNITAKLFYHHSYVKSGQPRENSITKSQKQWKIL